MVADADTIAGLAAFSAVMMFLFCCYACDLPKLFYRRRNRVTTNTESSSCGLRNFGLSSDAIASLPVMTDADDKMECAVCLTEFREAEKGRLLPKCRHSFHTECIDMWFRSHSTCPLCRVVVESDSGNDPAGCVINL